MSVNYTTIRRSRVRREGKGRGRCAAPFFALSEILLRRRPGGCRLTTQLFSKSHSSRPKPPDKQIVVYNGADDVRLEVQTDGETVWLSGFAARLISAWQFRYKTPTSLKMMKAKENILLYLGDFATYSQISRYR